MKLSAILAALLLASPLAIGHAHAFSTVRDSDIHSDGTSHFTDPDQNLKRDDDGRTTSWQFDNGNGSSFSYGVGVQGSDHPGYDRLGPSPVPRSDFFGRHH